MCELSIMTSHLHVALQRALYRTYYIHNNVCTLARIFAREHASCNTATSTHSRRARAFRIEASPELTNNENPVCAGVGSVGDAHERTGERDAGVAPHIRYAGYAVNCTHVVALHIFYRIVCSVHCATRCTQTSEGSGRMLTRRCAQRQERIENKEHRHAGSPECAAAAAAFAVISDSRLQSIHGDGGRCVRQRLLRLNPVNCNIFSGHVCNLWQNMTFVRRCCRHYSWLTQFAATVRLPTCKMINVCGIPKILSLRHV